MTSQDRQILEQKLELLRENVTKPQGKGKHVAGHIAQMREAIIEIEGKLNPRLEIKHFPSDPENGIIGGTFLIDEATKAQIEEFTESSPATPLESSASPA